MDLLIDPRGRVRCIYSEALDLAALGQVSIRRASHVEPDPQGRWWADLTPVGGPTLGPFELRSEALSAEQEWLAEHWLPCDQATEPQHPLPRRTVMETQKIEMYVGRYDGDARTWYETAVEIPADTLPEEVEGAALQALASRLEGSDGPVAFYGVMPVWTTAGKEVSCV